MPFTLRVAKNGGRKPGSRNKPLPNVWVPTALLDALDQASSHFANAPKRSRVAAAYLILSRQFPRYQHDIKQDCFWIRTRDLDALFGKDRFKSFNKQVHAFVVYRRENIEVPGGRRVTNAYKLSDWVLEAVDRYLDSTMPTGFVDLHYQRRRTPLTQGVIPSKDVNGQRATRIINIRHFVPVNGVAIEKALHRLTDASSQQRLQQSDLKRIREQLRFIQRQAHNSIEPGAIPQQYIEVESGRLYGTDLHFQNMKREVKRIALAGNLDYDFSNSQFTIFHQLAKRAGYNTKFISDYLANKKEIRKSLGSELDLPIDKVKQLLIAILHGGQTPTERTPNSKMRELFDDDLEQARDAMAHPFVQGIREDRREGSRAILGNWRVRANKKTMKWKNACGKSIELPHRADRLSDESRKRLLAHILQGAEARALNIACQPLKNDLLLLQHDGFAVRQPVDVTRIQNDICANQGLQMELEYEPLEPDF